MMAWLDCGDVLQDEATLARQRSGNGNMRLLGMGWNV
jgi:hypothetical protein